MCTTESLIYSVKHWYFKLGEIRHMSQDKLTTICLLLINIISTGNRGGCRL